MVVEQSSRATRCSRRDRQFPDDPLETCLRDSTYKPLVHRILSFIAEASALETDPQKLHEDVISMLVFVYGAKGQRQLRINQGEGVGMLLVVQLVVKQLALPIASGFGDVLAMFSDPMKNAFCGATASLNCAAVLRAILMECPRREADENLRKTWHAALAQAVRLLLEQADATIFTSDVLACAASSIFELQVAPCALDGDAPLPVAQLEQFLGHCGEDEGQGLKTEHGVILGMHCILPSHRTACRAYFLALLRKADSCPVAAHLALGCLERDGACFNVWAQSYSRNAAASNVVLSLCAANDRPIDTEFASAVIAAASAVSKGEKKSAAEPVTCMDTLQIIKKLRCKEVKKALPASSSMEIEAQRVQSKGRGSKSCQKLSLVILTLMIVFALAVFFFVSQNRTGVPFIARLWK